MLLYLTLFTRVGHTVLRDGITATTVNPMDRHNKATTADVRSRARSSPRHSSEPAHLLPIEALPAEPTSLGVRLLEVLSNLDRNIQRIADRLDPAPPDIVGTPYVAQKLDCTTTWIADQIRSGEIPRACLVPGTGNGKPWKFHRAQIDRWIASR